MREAKFRAWDEINKVMVYSGETWQPNAMQLPHLKPQKVEICDHFIVYPFESSDHSFVRVYDKDGKMGRDYYSSWDYDKFFSQGLVFLQFTGRKDKNGKEAYGGDIVKFPNHEYLAEVKYCPEFAAFLFDSHNDETRNNPDAQMLWSDAFEIIGNIHENPELLEANLNKEDTNDKNIHNTQS